jgi:DnaJ homolog subfamily C member 2
MPVAVEQQPQIATMDAVKMMLPLAKKDQQEDIKVHKRIAHTITRPLEPVGAAFMDRIRRHKHNRSLLEDYQIQEALREATQDNDTFQEDEPETPKLLKSDPGKWKEQDHYAILGLSKRRYLATEEDIKQACNLVLELSLWICIRLTCAFRSP